MTRFTNGPATGVTLLLRRVPIYLRVVAKQRQCGRPEWDALDQVDDTPTSDETLYAYRKVSDDGTVHINRGRHGSGFYAIATYEFIEPQPSDTTMRDTQQWRDWCYAQHKPS